MIGNFSEKRRIPCQTLPNKLLPNTSGIMKRPPVNEDKELADEDDNLSEDSGASDSYSGDDNYIDGNIAGEEAEDAEDMNAQGNDVLSGSMDEKSLSNNSRQQPTAAGAAARRKGAKKNKGGAGGKTGKSGGSNKGGGVGGGRGGGSRGKGSNGAGTTRGNKHSRNNTTNNNVTTTTNKASLNREDSNDDFNDPSYKDKNKDNAGQTAVIRFSHKPSAAFRLTGSQMNLMNSSASRGFVGVSQSESYMKFLTGSVKKVKAVIDRNIMERASKEFSGSKTLGSNINLNSSSNSRGGGGNNTTARGAGGKQSAAANVFTVGKPPVIEKISIEEERMREAEMARERELYKLRRSDPIKFRRVIRRERAKEYIAQKWQRLQAIRVK